MARHISWMIASADLCLKFICDYSQLSHELRIHWYCIAGRCLEMDVWDCSYIRLVAMSE